MTTPHPSCDVATELRLAAGSQDLMVAFRERRAHKRDLRAARQDRPLSRVSLLA